MAEIQHSEEAPQTMQATFHSLVSAVLPTKPLDPNVIGFLQDRSGGVVLQTHYAYFLVIARSGRYFLIDVPGAMQPWSIDTPDRDYASGISRVEDVSEVLVCYALRVSESPSNLQRNRVTS